MNWSVLSLIEQKGFVQGVKRHTIYRHRAHWGLLYNLYFVPHVLLRRMTKEAEMNGTRTRAQPPWRSPLSRNLRYEKPSSNRARLENREWNIKSYYWAEKIYGQPMSVVASACYTNGTADSTVRGKRQLCHLVSTNSFIWCIINGFVLHRHTIIWNALQFDTCSDTENAQNAPRSIREIISHPIRCIEESSPREYEISIFFLCQAFYSWTKCDTDLFQENSLETFQRVPFFTQASTALRYQ